MELQDFSHLRPSTVDGNEREPITVPLNGQRYHCDPEPPANVVLAATTGTDITAMELMARAAGGEELTPAEQARAAAVGEGSLVKAVRFLDAVLEPESRQRWAYYMSAPPEKATPAKRKEHDAGRITLVQVVHVFRALIAQYSGGRPTTAPSSSGNGHDGAGATSTAGQPDGE